VKAVDVQRAAEILKKNYMKSVGLNSDELLGTEAVFDIEAETVTCPACATRFKPNSRICPDCGLQFG
jgi:rRNA maturation endonuclease Nob1